MPLERWKVQLQKIKLKQVALELMTLSGAIRRADVEIHFRSPKTIQSMARHTRRHTRWGEQD